MSEPPVMPGQMPSPASSADDCLLSVEAVRQSYAVAANGEGPTESLAGITFQVCEGEFICIVGPSGCGKSTLLRILGGLLTPTAGRVCLHGESLDGPRREIGYVFQHANLMPWRTILSNVTLPLELQHVPVASAEARSRQVLSLVGLEGFEQAYPRQLSGGMAQRAALARTLVHEPTLLLLDEPFGALDAITRERMTLELQRIRQALPYTAVMVTHSISEAVFLAGRVLVMSQRPGRIVAEVAVPFPYPRPLEIFGTPEFAGLTQAVRRAIVTDP